MEIKDTHPDPISEECETCHSIFGNKRLLQIHRGKSKECSLEFIRKDKANCAICDKLCVRMGLVAHMKSHNNMCRICQVKCADLKEHMKIHAHSQSYMCDQCTFKTTTKKLLQIHMDRLHSTKLFECVLCKFETNHSVNLKNHVNKVHENIKYSCDICGHQIANISNLYQHKRRKHKMVDFKPTGRGGRTKKVRKTDQFHCDLCKSQFSHAHNLKRHKKINCRLGTHDASDDISIQNGGTGGNDTFEDSTVNDCADVQDMFVVSLLLLLIAIVLCDILPRREVSNKKRNMSNFSTKQSSQEKGVSKKKPQLSEDIKVMLESLNKNVSYTLLRKEISGQKI